MKNRIFLMLVLAVVLTGTNRADVIVDVTFGHLAYDTDSETANGQLALDTSGNQWDGFYGGGTIPITAGPTGTTALDSSATNGYILLRDALTKSSHGEPSRPDPYTTATPYFVLEADKSYTFEAILQWDPNSTDSIHGLMGSWVSTSISAMWIREENGFLEYDFDDGPTMVQGLDTVDISALEADGLWHHIAIVLDRSADEIRVYADYQLIYTDTNPLIASLGEITIPDVGDLRLGAYSTSTSRGFDGLQDHYRISNEALAPKGFLQMSGASAPTPADGTIEVDPAGVGLSWTSAPDPNAPTELITGQYIYIGTDPAALVLQNPTAQVGTTFTTGTLVKDQRYYWRVDGQVNSGAANDPNLIVAGLVWSFQTELSIPVIDVQPKDDRVFVDVGDSAEFTVAATDPLAGTLTYQWYEGVSPDTSSPVADANEATLTIANVVTADVGRQFYCQVSNAASPIDTVSAAIIAKTQVAHWKLDDIGETEPNAIDSSGNGYDGTNVGAVLAAGKIDEAFDFNKNAGDYVDLSAHIGTLGALEQGTITAWIKRNEVVSTDPGVIISAYDSAVASTEARFFTLQEEVRWQARDQNGNPNGELNVISAPLPTDDQWHMVAITVDGDQNATAYVDGIAGGSGVAPFFGQIAILNGIAIGRNVDSGTVATGQWHYDGQLDDIQIYDYPMTAYEIADAYVAVDGPICVEAPLYDLNDDCEVDLEDISIVATAWLDCNLYPASACN